jgi:hypothetical protein
MESVFSVGASPGLYNEDLRLVEGKELRESLEAAVEDDEKRIHSVSYSGL